MNLCMNGEIFYENRFCLYKCVESLASENEVTVAWSCVNATCLVKPEFVMSYAFKHLRDSLKTLKLVRSQRTKNASVHVYTSIRGN